MSEESDPKILELAKSDVEILEYDFMKHISTLSLVTLGGVLSLAQSKSDMSADRVVLAVVLIAIAGAFAISGLDTIIQAKKKGKPLGWMYRSVRTISIYAFGAGIGVFLALFLDIFKN